MRSKTCFTREISKNPEGYNKKQITLNKTLDIDKKN